MGLDTSHGCWSGSYHGFNQWRRAVARTVGIDLYAMCGFGGDGAWNEADPLTTLLDHSDCDGDIPADKCGPLADRLEELLPTIEDYDDAGWTPDTWRNKARQFIDGLRAAAAAGEPVEFH